MNIRKGESCIPKENKIYICDVNGCAWMRVFPTHIDDKVAFIVVGEDVVIGHDMKGCGIISYSMTTHPQ